MHEVVYFNLTWMMKAFGPSPKFDLYLFGTIFARKSGKYRYSVEVNFIFSLLKART